MKYLNKYLLIAATALCFVACSDDETFEPGAPSSATGEKVYFSDENESSIVAGLEDETFDVTLVREDATNAATIPVKGVCSYEGIFEVPETVSFEAGSSTATLSVKMSDKMEAFKSYPLTITVDEAYTNAYKQNDLVPMIELSVLKEDYAPYAEGIYYSDFWEESWEDVIEYSPMLDTYRMKDWWAGQGYTFQWDKETNKLTMTESYFGTLVEYGNYGQVYGYTTGGGFKFYPKGSVEDFDGDTFYFPFEWRVSAGSFGTYYEAFTVSNYVGGASSAKKMNKAQAVNHVINLPKPERELK